MAHTDLQQPASPVPALSLGGRGHRRHLRPDSWPGVTLMVLVLLLGAYAFVSGLFAVVVGAAWTAGLGVNNRDGTRR